MNLSASRMEENHSSLIWLREDKPTDLIKPTNRSNWSDQAHKWRQGNNRSVWGQFWTGGHLSSPLKEIARLGSRKKIAMASHLHPFVLLIHRATQSGDASTMLLWSFNISLMSCMRRQIWDGCMVLSNIICAQTLSWSGILSKFLDLPWKLGILRDSPTFFA